jgi:hypothetical protein
MSSKDLLLKIMMEFRRNDILKISKDGEYAIRLVHPRGEEGASPFVQVRTHTGFLAFESKTHETFICPGKNCEMCKEHLRRKESGDLRADWIKAKNKYHYLTLWNDSFRILEVDWFLQREILGIDGDSLGPIAKSIENGINVFSSTQGRSLIIEKKSSPALKYKLIGLTKEDPLSALQIERLKNAPDIMASYYRPSVLETKLIVDWTNKKKAEQELSKKMEIT